MPSTAAFTSSSSNNPLLFDKADPSSTKYASVDVADDENPDFDPFSLDAVPYGTEEADLDDPYDSNELGLEELLGIEDVDEIGKFLEKGVKFTEDRICHR